MKIICNIEKSIYSCVASDIVSSEVVLTDERIQHIRLRHPNDYERYEAYMRLMLEEPDFIIEDAAPDTAFVLKEFEAAETRFRLILRLHTARDESSRKNSVLTFQYIKSKEYDRLIRNKKILYRRPEL